MSAGTTKSCHGMRDCLCTSTMYSCLRCRSIIGRHLGLVCSAHEHLRLPPAMLQVFRTESTFTIHHANAFEDPDTPGDVLIWSSGWGPATLKAVAARAKVGAARLNKHCAAYGAD